MLAIAHRGASGYEAENTIAAFKKAIDLGADMIELDVRMCKSGEVIVIHDPKLDRTTDGYGEVNRKTLTEIKAYKTINGESIPTLEEVLDIVHHSIKLNINVKEDVALEPTAKIMHRYVEENGWKYTDFIISYARIFKLKKLKKRYPKLLIAPIIVFLPSLWTRIARSCKPYSFSVHKYAVNKKLIDFAKKRKIHVYVWTVNSDEDLEKYKKLDITGIITNYPDKI